MKLFRNILTGILAVIFGVSSLMALHLALDHRAGSDSYAEALALASGSEPTSAVTEPAPTDPEPGPFSANILPQTFSKKQASCLLFLLPSVSIFGILPVYGKENSFICQP